MMSINMIVQFTWTLVGTILVELILNVGGPFLKFFLECMVLATAYAYYVAMQRSLSRFSRIETSEKMKICWSLVGCENFVEI